MVSLTTFACTPFCKPSLHGQLGGTIHGISVARCSTRSKTNREVILAAEFFDRRNSHLYGLSAHFLFHISVLKANLRVDAQHQNKRENKHLQMQRAM
jgi:hypothetical protein